MNYYRIIVLYCQEKLPVLNRKMPGFLPIPIPCPGLKSRMISLFYHKLIDLECCRCEPGFWKKKLAKPSPPRQRFKVCLSPRNRDTLLAGTGKKGRCEHFFQAVEKMRVAFIGSTKRGYLTLKALLEGGANVAGVVSLAQHAHETERYEQNFSELAARYNVPCQQTQWMKDRDYAALLKDEWQADVAFVVGCRVLIPREVYQVPRLGSLAVHDSLLPEYRGFAPLNWAILNDEDHTGVTLFYLSEAMDEGDIVLQQCVPIGPDETAPQIYEKVCQATVDVVLAGHAALLAGNAPRVRQTPDSGSYTCSRTPLDGCIDWQRPTREIYNLVRALTSPYPGAFTYYNGKKLLIWAAMPARHVNYIGRISGRVIGFSSDEGWVDVLTGDGVLRLTSVQLEDGEPVPPASLIKSVRIRLGFDPAELLERLRSLEERLEALGKTTSS